MTKSPTDTRDWRNDLIMILRTRGINNERDWKAIAPFLERWADERAATITTEAYERGKLAAQVADTHAFVEIIDSLEKIVAGNDGRDYSQRVDDIRTALEFARTTALTKTAGEGER